MKLKYLLLLAMTLSSGFAAASDDLQCYLYRNDNMDNPIAITSNNFGADGALSISEADAVMAQPEISKYGFQIKVENKTIVLMHLEDKSEGLVAENSDASTAQYKEVVLQSKDTAATLMCFSNYLP